MKLKAQLAIAFFTMVMGPVILFTLFLFLFGMRQSRFIEDTFGIEFSISYFFNPTQMINDSTETVWNELHRLSEEDPDAFRRQADLNAINDKLEMKQSYLVFVYENEMVYQGIEDDLKDLNRRLPGYGNGVEQGKPVYIGGALHAVIRQQDIVFSDGTYGSAYIVTETEDITPSFRTMVVEAAMAILFVLFVSALGMAFWIYRGINAPLGRLKDATHQITDGNLNFTMHAEGNDEISELTRDFETMRQRLKTSEEEKVRFDRENRELIRNISHDLKTPITSIKGYMEGILDGVADTPEKMDRYIRTVYNKANDMDRLIEELTFYSNIDAKRIPYDFTILDVVDYFNDCAEELRLELEETGISFSYHNMIPAGTRIIADPEQLRRVIHNIVSNSEKYMDKPARKIELRILDEGDFVQVEIEDNGKGIETRDLTRVFDRFYRSDEARSTSRGGSGIGLSIVKKIIEDHGGQIWARSRIREGTTMAFVIRKYQET